MTTTVNPQENLGVDLIPTPAIEMPDGRIFEASTRIREPELPLYAFLGEAGLVHVSGPFKTEGGSEQWQVYADTSLPKGTVLNVRKWLAVNADPIESLTKLTSDRKVSLVTRALAAIRPKNYGDDVDEVIANMRQPKEEFGDKLKQPADFRSYMARQTLPVVGEDVDTGELPYRQNK